MPTTRLTDAAAQRLKAPPGKRIEYFDRLLPGFGLRVSAPPDQEPGEPKATGRRRRPHKAWFVVYRVRGRLRRLTLGTYPALPLKDARDQARNALLAAKRGEDPAAIRQAERNRAVDTVEVIVDDFMKRHMEGKRRAPRYIADVRRMFDRHVLPRWRGRDIREITRRDVIELLDRVADGDRRTGGRQVGGPIAANRTLGAISRLFTWSLQRGIVDATPAARIERPGEERRRDRELSRDEIAEVWPQFDKLGYPFGSFFKMLLATGQRRIEVATMRWRDVNEAEHLWTLPAENTKAGRAHTVPLSPLALSILADCRRELEATWKTTSEFVFTTTGDRAVSGFSRAKASLEKLLSGEREKQRLEPGTVAHEPERWTIHDLRRTVATGLARFGTPRVVISRVLNHADASVTAIYDRHAYGQEKRHALEQWGSYLGDVTAPPDDKVVRLRG